MTEIQNKISLADIILPNYNKAEFLDETIKSIINQSFKNFKLYIIDDFSNDNSLQIIKKYSDSRIKLISLKENKGVSFCRNLGLGLASSKYIAFIDSDDYWDKNKLENQIKFMEKFNYSFTYTDYIPFTFRGNDKKFKKKIIVKKEFNFNQFIHNTSIAMSTVIVKRSLIKNIKFKKLKICEDYLFKCEILKNNKAFKCDDGLMYYCISKNSLQSNKFRNLYWVWKINKNFNNLNILSNIKSVISISFNSIKKYGFK
tara:strand:+ start:149 stop:919 length:771 start_codon:yes stop_codon:yes gene_type:complete